MRYVRLIIVGIVLGLTACATIYVFNPTRLRQDSDQVRESATPSPVPSLAPTPSDAPVVEGLTNVNILLYSVNMTVSVPISDLVYGEIDYGGSTVAGFTTQSLLAKYPDCTAGSLGYLVRYKAYGNPSPTPTPQSTENSDGTTTYYIKPFKKTVDGYTYEYRNSYSSCAGDQAGRDEVAADRVAVQNSALPTLSVTPPAATPSPTATPK